MHLLLLVDLFDLQPPRRVPHRHQLRVRLHRRRQLVVARCDPLRSGPLRFLRHRRLLLRVLPLRLRRRLRRREAEAAAVHLAQPRADLLPRPPQQLLELGATRRVGRSRKAHSRWSSSSAHGGPPAFFASWREGARPPVRAGARRVVLARHRPRDAGGRRPPPPRDARRRAAAATSGRTCASPRPDRHLGAAFGLEILVDIGERVEIDLGEERRVLRRRLRRRRLGDRRLLRRLRLRRRRRLRRRHRRRHRPLLRGGGGGGLDLPLAFSAAAGFSAAGGGSLWRHASGWPNKSSSISWASAT